MGGAVAFVVVGAVLYVLLAEVPDRSRLDGPWPVYVPFWLASWLAVALLWLVRAARRLHVPVSQARRRRAVLPPSEDESPEEPGFVVTEEALAEDAADEGSGLDVDACIAELRSGEPRRCRQAVERLVEIGPAALPKLRLLLEDPDPDVRVDAAKAIDGIGEMQDEED